MSNIKRTGELELATDAQCAARRRALIKAGIITERNCNLIKKGDGSVAVSTKDYSSQLRKGLVERGILDSKYIEIPPAKYEKPLRTEEGEYKVRPIKTKEQYDRRKIIYLRMLQEILISRRELGLVLGPKSDKDPDWIF